MADYPNYPIASRNPQRVTLRLLQMLDAVEAAGFSPISFQALHGFAYLGNLLAPLWDVDPLDGKVLKTGTPYYPELREALERVIFLGLVELVSFEPVRLSDGTWIGAGEVGLNTRVTRPILNEMDIFSDERRIRDFLIRLALAIAPVSNELASLVTLDVTWTDNRVGRGDVLDFAEWRDANYTLNAVQTFDRAMPKGMIPTRGEKLQYYVHLLERRAAVRNRNERRSA
jgi:hypothetical protein